MVPKCANPNKLVIGNCFVLLCVMHTHSGKKLMWKEMKDRTISLKKKQKVPETVLII